MSPLARWLARLALAGVAAAALVVGALWAERRGVVALPAPTGSLPVGRVTLHWTDSSTPDRIAPVPGATRELLAWIWYPSAADPASASDDYIPPAMRASYARALAPPRGLGKVLGFLTRDAANVRTHSAHEPPVSPEQPRYPVVLLRAGASTSVSNYASLAEDLASHGYVVAGIDAPYRTGAVAFSDGRVLQRSPENNPELLIERRQMDRLAVVFSAWVADMGFALDRLTEMNTADPTGRFTGRLDLARVGVFGHSWGGAQAMQFCAADDRCRAAIDIDGAPFGPVVQSGVRKPLMFLLSDLGDFSSDAENRQILADVQSLYDRAPPDRRAYVSIAGGSHFTFSDDGALLKSGLIRGVLRLFGKLRIDGRRQLEVAAYAVRAFFDATLNATSASRPALASTSYPELRGLP